MNEEILAASPSSSQPTIFVTSSASPLPTASTSSTTTTSIRYQIIPQTPPMSRLTGDRATSSSNSSGVPPNSTIQSQTTSAAAAVTTTNSHSLSTVLVNSTSNSNDGDEERGVKRIKLENNDFSASSNDLAALKRRILEHKYMRLKSVKEKYSDHVAELFFLQSNMNMMEYPTWRKKPQTPEFMNFVRAHRLDQSQLDELSVISLKTLFFYSKN